MKVKELEKATAEARNEGERIQEATAEARNEAERIQEVIAEKRKVAEIIQEKIADATNKADRIEKEAAKDVIDAIQPPIGIHPGFDWWFSFNFKWLENLENKIDETPNIKPSYIRSKYGNKDSGSKDEKSWTDWAFFEKLLENKGFLTVMSLMGGGFNWLQGRVDKTVEDINLERQLIWEAKRDDYLTRYWYRPYKHSEAREYATKESPPKITVGDYLRGLEDEVNSDPNDSKTLMSYILKGPLDE